MSPLYNLLWVTKVVETIWQWHFSIDAIQYLTPYSIAFPSRIESLILPDPKFSVIWSAQSWKYKNQHCVGKILLQSVSIIFWLIVDKTSINKYKYWNNEASVLPPKITNTWWDFGDKHDCNVSQYHSKSITE